MFRHYTTRLSGSSIDLSGAKYDFRKDTLYVTKSISLICSQPFVNTSSLVLKSIYKFISRHDYDLQVLESFIYNLLYDIPLPSPGRSVRFWCLGSEAIISLQTLQRNKPFVRRISQEVLPAQSPDR